jgi:hypothetical protein
MDCTTTAAVVSGIGGVIELLGIVTLAADLLYTGRVPNLKLTTRKLLRRPPPVVYGRASGGIELNIGIEGSAVLVPAPERPRWWSSPWRRYHAQLRQLERRMDELRDDLGRERTARAEAIAALERSLQPTLQSLQNEITALRHDLTTDRARTTSRPWVAWFGIAAFVFGLMLNTLGTFMSARCT